MRIRQIIKSSFGCLIIIFFCTFTVDSNADDLNKREKNIRQPLFNVIKTVPANKDNFSEYFIINKYGDGLGEEMPSSIMYFKKNTKDYFTSMAITDLNICNRPIEKNICRSFLKMISNSSPSLGTNITKTRIGGSGYGTIFLKKVESVKFEGVDNFIAFIGADSQDPPSSDIVLYIYAKKGTNLIQLCTPVDKCIAHEETNQSDISFYKQYCVNEKILNDAKSKGKMLTELFRLKK